MDAAREPTVLDYARSHGLASDHRQHDHFYGIDLELPGTDDEDHPELFEIEAQAVDPLQERLIVDKNVAQILASITRPAETSLRFDEDVEPNTNKWQKLKLELPVLKTDHEADLRQFLQPHNPSLGQEHLPLEGLDEELDEGLRWPSHCLKLGEQIEHQCWTEKLVISEDVIGVLADVVRNEPSDADLKFDTENLLTYEKNAALTPVTPPLLPLPKPYQPSSETGRLELVSEGPSPTKQTLDAIDERLMVRDRPTANTFTLEHDPSATAVTTPDIQAQEHPTGQEAEKTQDGTSFNLSKGEAPSQDEMLLDSEALGELYSPLKFINETPSSPIIRLKKKKPPKMEVPMTPPRSDLRAPKTEEDDMLAQAIKSIAQTTFEKNPKMDLPSSQELDAFFAETIEPVAKKADQAIEQEQLQDTDTLGRVPVPPMDFSLAGPPWRPEHTVKSQNRTESILHDLKTQHLQKAHWPAVGKVERQLQWAPFPAALARVETQETIDGGDCLDEYLRIPECVDTGSLVWKPDGLRMFDDLNDPEEEEVPNGKLLASDDIRSLIKKRKLTMQYDDLGPSSGEAEALQETQARATARQAEKRQRTAGEEVGPVYHEENRPVPSEQQETGGILAAHPLQDYLSLRRGDVSISAIQNKPVAEDRSKPRTAGKVTAHLPTNSTSTERQLSKLSTADHPAVEVQNIASAPVLTIPTEESSFIISTSYMQNRKLIRQIEQSYPTAKFIERDFSLYAALKTTGIKEERAEVQPADRTIFEADLILSPGTALVTTTLQKVKQRALPGQKAASAIHERIAKVSPRYEKLLILVTSGAPSSAAEGGSKFAALNADDTEALTAFIAFCAAVQEENQVYFICDDMDNLANWIVSFMILYRAENHGAQLLPEETLWEVFLRRAGLNAFAAQAICASLKEIPRDKVDGQRPPVEHGLKAFLSMSTDSRIARFGRLFGGSNLLRKVGHALDTSWR